ncbi:hypothetical protein ACFX19_022135 [Malus domestica]
MFSGGREEIGAQLNRLEQLQNNWEANVEEIQSLSGLIDKLEAIDKLFWWQRSRVKWLQDEDFNSRPIVLEEIKDAIFQMGGMKALGLDGFHGVFYHSFWDIIANDMNGLV